MPFSIPGFDALFNQILTDWRNGTIRDEDGNLVQVDTSQGSLVFLRSACFASALWGLYRYQEWISRQIFADQADTENLEHHAWTRGLSRTYGETDAALLARYLDYIRRPPAGGNKHDYEQWALTIDGVAAAYCFPIAQGLGTVDVVIVANEETTGSETPSASARSGLATSVTAGKLIDADADFTTAGRPVVAGDVVVNTVQELETTVTAVDSAVQLSLADDIFKFAGESYHVHFHTGESTSAAVGKLIDTGAAFTDATYTLKPGDVVENLTDGTETTATAVDSATQLSLVADIFGAAGKQYVVRSLTARVKEYIDTVRPVTASLVSVLGPTITAENVTMTVTGATANKVQIASDITAYLQSFVPGQVLYRAQLSAIAVLNGAANVTVTAPAADVVPDDYEMLRPGVISVT